MEKRTILAISLSLLILLSWSLLVSKTQPVDNKRVIEQSVVIDKAAPQPTPQPVLAEAEVAPASLATISSGKTEIVFIEPQAAIKEVVFPAYQNYKFPLEFGFWLKEKKIIFHKESDAYGNALFIYNDHEKRIIKRFIFHKSDYSMELEIEIQSLSATSLPVSLSLALGVLDFSGDQNQARLKDFTVVTNDKINHPNAHKDSSFEGIKFIGLRDRYFCAILEPASTYYSAHINKISPQKSELSLRSKEITLAPGEKITERFRIYLGPQELNHINRINPAWSAVMYFGTFDFISHFLLQLLDFIYNLVHNWGVAIIILSILIYLILYPFSLKQMRSMKQMQALQPRIEELKKIYKDNPQKLNKEIMELYRTYKINPFSGCLPLILQMPVFFALYQVLIRSVALKGANFLWIKNLSEADRLFIIPSLSPAFPIIGNEINILPILMTIGMFFQQKISTKNASGASAEQQKMMLFLFPLMFGFIFYKMPSGLVLYWFVNNILMLVQQLYLSKKNEP